VVEASFIVEEEKPALEESVGNSSESVLRETKLLRTEGTTLGDYRG